MRQLRFWMITFAAACGLAMTADAASAQRFERPMRERSGSADPDPSLQLEGLAHDGIERTYLIARPDAAAREGGYPVVIGLHGGGSGDAAVAAEVQRFHAIETGEPLIVVYPNGVGAEWNDGRGVAFKRTGDPTADDVGFLSALIDRLIERDGADPSRIYLAGASNGAMMTHRAGCELAGKLAAIAPVIAPMPANIAHGCAPGQPLPILMILGEADPWVPFEGGEVTPLGRPSGQVISADATMALWAGVNHCMAQPTVTLDARRRARDGTRIRRETYSRCAAATVLIIVEGGGHAWPGSDRAGPAASRLLGQSTRQIDASAEIWAFFQDTRRHGR
ncbi:MAG: esterase [Alphaproteobacteria bacterium]|nr:esterase [Alphaproteobacteria bacterium]